MLCISYHNRMNIAENTLNVCMRYVHVLSDPPLNSFFHHCCNDELSLSPAIASCCSVGLDGIVGIVALLLLSSAIGEFVV